MRNTLFGQTDYNGFNRGFLTQPLELNPSYEEVGSVEFETSRLRVACYCRVSTSLDAQENSLENQIIHYTRYIRSNSNWHFAGVYSDRGKSGTKSESRVGLQNLMRHALEGKIDLILCKSISRFARNVADTLNLVRILKEKGVRIVFEKEGIDTGNMQSEFILTMLSATAQDESRSISDNVNWSIAKRFQRGEPMFTRMLGYAKDDNNNWIIIEEEAQVVREAFAKCLKGVSPAQIAKLFIQKGYKKASGRIDWSSLAVRDVLKNERYTGDVLCQKSYTKDHLSHQQVKNKGERNQYLIKQHHEAIVDRVTFEKAQEMLAKRAKPKQTGRRNKYPLSGRVICDECGSTLHRYICRGIVSWRCSNHVKSKKLCKLTRVKEEDIIKAMAKAFTERYQLSDQKESKGLIVRMLKEFKGAVLAGEYAYNQLQVEIERVLFAENMAILNVGNEERSDLEEELNALAVRRKEVEAELATKETWRKLLEEDYKYRKVATEILEELVAVRSPGQTLKEKLKIEEFLRAWVVRVKALSPISFSLTWLNGDETYVKVEKGDG